MFYHHNYLFVQNYFVFVFRLNFTLDKEIYFKPQVLYSLNTKKKFLTLLFIKFLQSDGQHC